jgi:hypothetical protein
MHLRPLADIVTHDLEIGTKSAEPMAAHICKPGQ